MPWPTLIRPNSITVSGSDIPATLTMNLKDDGAGISYAVELPYIDVVPLVSFLLVHIQQHMHSLSAEDIAAIRQFALDSQSMQPIPEAVGFQSLNNDEGVAIGLGFAKLLFYYSPENQAKLKNYSGN